MDHIPPDDEKCNDNPIRDPLSIATTSSDTTTTTRFHLQPSECDDTFYIDVLVEEPAHMVPNNLVDDARKELLLYKTSTMPKSISSFPMIKQYWREPWFFELAFELGLCFSVRTGCIKDKTMSTFISTTAGISKDLAKLLHIAALVFKAQKVVCDGVVSCGGASCATRDSPADEVVEK